MDNEWQEIIVASTSNEHSIGVWDLSTGTLLTSYKGNASGRNGLSTLGRHYLVAAQAGKSSALHFWTWNKDQIHQKSFTSQQIVSVACSPDGVYCAGGSSKGTVFIWECTSGKLLRYWSAHYKAVNDLAFSKDGSFLVSGGEDASVSVWLLMDLLDLKKITTLSTPPSLVTWSSHTLPVSSVCIGCCSGDTIILSASLDRTCKIWNLETLKLQRTISVPSSLHSVTLDRWESSVFLGAADGKIYQAHLHGTPAQPEAEKDTLSKNPKAQALQQAGIEVLSGHSKCVNSLATTSDSFGLISGSDDGTIKVWDIQSRQVLRSIAAKGPVTSVLVIKQLVQKASMRNSARGKKGQSGIEPLGVFGKQVEIASNSLRPENGWNPPPIILDGCQSYRGIVSQTGLLGNSAVQEDLPEPQDTRGDQVKRKASEADVDRLEQQLESAKKAILELRATNSKLHAFVMQSSAKQTS